MRESTLGEYTLESTHWSVYTGEYTFEHTLRSTLREQNYRTDKTELQNRVDTEQRTELRE
jgi:hypothetical protein